MLICISAALIPHPPPGSCNPGLFTTRKAKGQQLKEGHVLLPLRGCVHAIKVVYSLQYPKARHYNIKCAQSFFFRQHLLHVVAPCSEESLRFHEYCESELLFRESIPVPPGKQESESCKSVTSLKLHTNCKQLHLVLSAST